MLGWNPARMIADAWLDRSTSPSVDQAPCAMPSRLSALVAARYRPEWKERYQRLLDRGRAKKEALTILSRALLKVIFHILRTGAAYDPDCVKRSPAPATA